MRAGTVSGRAALLAGLAIVLAFILSAPGQAGTVDATHSVVFTAAPGETNNLTITQSGNAFTIVDNWPLTALGPCVSTDMFTAVCTTIAEDGVTAFLGDLNDTAVVAVDLAPRVDGGAGADTITTSAELFNFFREDDAVNGGPGNDILASEGEALSVITGGAGDDEISSRGSLEIDGGGGNDLIDVRQAIEADAWGGPGDDRLLGGLGEDFLDGNNGHDTVIGGAGPDLLTGGAGHDVIRGGRGHDILSGGWGDDLIVGGAGSELAWGGRGDDTFLMRDGYRDRAIGSYGFDRAAIDQYDRVRFIEKLL